MSRGGPRSEVAQLAWFLKVHRGVAKRHRVRTVALHLDLPSLPRRWRREGSVWAVTMVRDEEDVIARSVRHLLDQGVDHVLVADNLSTDATPRILVELAADDPRIHVATDRLVAYFQTEKMSRLARAAAYAGADWVVPFDADELWFAERGTVKEELVRLGREGPMVGIVKARAHDAIPTSDGGWTRPDPELVMDSTPRRPGKVAVRAHRLMSVNTGNHGAPRVGRAVTGLRVAHVMYRSADQVARKTRQGAVAVDMASHGPVIGAHWRAVGKLDDEQVQAMWERMTRGEPQPLAHFNAVGPMVRVRPLGWRTWDPDGQLANTAGEREVRRS